MGPVQKSQTTSDAISGRTPIVSKSTLAFNSEKGSAIRYNGDVDGSMLI